MNETRENLRWELRQRLMLLEAYLIWAGRVTAADLQRCAGTSRAQASKDIDQYRRLWPDNLRHEPQEGAFCAGDAFEPGLLRGTAQEFLQVLRNHQVSPQLPLSVVAADVAPVELLEPPERAFDVRILQRVTAAIRTRRWLRVEYQSMSHPEPRNLEIAPHALAHSGRWHARAFSREHDGYRDFLLSRIGGLPELGEAADLDAGQDWEWQKYVTVRVGAHPELSDAQRRVVEADYGMGSGVLEKQLRIAMVPYYLKMLGVGGDDRLRPAAEQQIVLLNRDELESYNRLA